MLGQNDLAMRTLLHATEWARAILRMGEYPEQDRIKPLSVMHRAMLDVLFSDGTGY